MAEEMVIFTRTFDFTQWLVQITTHFPRAQRFVVTSRLQGAVLDFYEKIVTANQGLRKYRYERLIEADAHLSIARHYLRLCHHMGWLTTGQYEHGSTYVAEIGRLLGGWMKQSLSSTTAKQAR